MDSLIILLVLAVAFFIRLYPSIKYPYLITSDGYYHLYCADVIRKNRLVPPDQLSQVMLENQYNYPFLYHFLLALFPKPYRLYFFRVSSPLFETGTIYLFTLFLQYHNLPKSLIYLYALLLAVWPGWLRVYAAPRAYSGSPRVPAVFFTSLHLLGFSVYQQTPGIYPLLLSATGGALTMLTSKFANQFLFFLFFPLVYLSDGSYLIIFLISLLIAAVLSKGRVFRIFYGQLNHSIVYARYLQQRFLYPVQPRFSSWKRDLCGLFSGEADQSFLQRFKVFLIFSRHPLHILLFFFTPFLFLPLLFFEPSPHLFYPLLFKVVVIVSFVLFILTSTRPLLFLGESFRYLEYATPFYLALFVPSFPALSLLYFFYSIFLIPLFYAEIKRRWGTQSDDFPAIKNLFQLSNIDPAKPIIPVGPFHWILLCFTRNPVFTYSGNTHIKLLNDQLFKLYLENYPYPSGEFQALIRLTGAGYIVSGPEQIRHYREKLVSDPDYFDAAVKEIGRTETVVLFEISKPKEHRDI